MGNKRLVVFSGPNGSGKSTVTQGFKNTNLPTLYINADDIQKEKGITALEAAQLATKLREELLLQGKSFVMETVLSTDRNIILMEQAKELEYEIFLVFILTQDPLINLERIKARVQMGGHDVPVDKVFSRYRGSLKLLPKALNLADTALIFNNSFKNPLLIVEKFNGSILIYPQPTPSKWNKDNLISLIGIENINDLYEYNDDAIISNKDLNTNSLKESNLFSKK